MGAGFHGGFGATYGSKVRVSYKLGQRGEHRKNYTREELIDFIDGVTKESTEIAAKIRKGLIKVNVLGDQLFEAYLGESHNTIALAVGNQIYLRNSSISIYSDMVHEGTHAMDFIKGIKESIISGEPGETRAYSAERRFQIAKGLPLDFKTEEDMMIHIWRNYRRR